MPKKAPKLNIVPEYIPSFKDKPDSVTNLGIQEIKKYKQAKEKKKAPTLSSFATVDETKNNGNQQQMNQNK